jgi:hypothetical protein
MKFVVRRREQGSIKSCWHSHSVNATVNNHSMAHA